MKETPTFYEVLGLPKSLQKDAVIPAATLRGAYRRALLQNHPDKTKNSPPVSKSTYTVDQISKAFAILADPNARREYDKQLNLETAQKHGDQDEQSFQTGVEVLDLDDLEEDEEHGLWYRGCRCGDSRGFLIEETDLEEAADEGELSVGCRGCSLWIKVLFGVIEESQQ